MANRSGDEIAVVTQVSFGRDESVEEASKPQFHVYKRRWFMLAVICLLNFANAMLWICYAPVANLTDSFYCGTSRDCGAANYLSLVYMIVSIPVGFLAMWSVDKFGLRSGIIFGSLVNLLGAVVRVISSIEQIPVDVRFPLVMLGQTISASSQPFIMYLPTKLAAYWFPENQRAVANTLGSMSNPLGIMVANLISPVIVTRPEDMLLLNGIMAAPCALVAILSVFGVCSTLPKSPPSSSAAETSEPFGTGFKLAIRNRSFMVLVFSLGMGMGLFNAVYTLEEQILCAKGYSNSFAGLCGALLIAGGLIGALVSGVIVDRTKRFEEIVKVSLCGGAVCGCIFAVFSLYHDMAVGIALSCTIFGAFGFAAYPVGLECGVETTYPVAEATSAGLIIVSGQLQGAIFVLLLTALEGELSPHEMLLETCTNGVTNVTVDAKDMKVPNLVLAGFAALMSVSIVLFFWPKYRRLATERKLTNAYLAGLRPKSPAEEGQIRDSLPPAYAEIVAAQPGPILLRPAALSRSESNEGADDSIHL